MNHQVEDVNRILKPEIEETLLHATASVGSILCAKLLLEVIFSTLKRFLPLEKISVPTRDELLPGGIVAVFCLYSEIGDMK